MEKTENKERYIIEITYHNDKKSEEVELITDDIDWSMEQYQRNRQPFKWKIKYHYKGI
jgi:hypothetical protein|tara:strand:- start:945 stop:1118 length:174 start_codon:yes stop_codon:yes gene_type:complete